MRSAMSMSGNRRGAHSVTRKALSSARSCSGGSPYSSMACTTFWKPVPRSSQMRKRRNDDASCSLRDSGVVPISRSGRLPGSSAPGLLNSMRSSNSSIIGPLPVRLKSWWISALAINSRSAISGNTEVSTRSACWMTSECGSTRRKCPMSPSKPTA